MARYKYLVTHQFKRDVRLCIKRCLPLEKLKAVIDILLETGQLPAEYKPHKLAGQWIGLWECHIQSDWLLFWEQRETEMVLLMTRTGTHSDIFD